MVPCSAVVVTARSAIKTRLRSAALQLQANHLLADVIYIRLNIIAKQRFECKLFQILWQHYKHTKNTARPSMNIGHNGYTFNSLL